MPNVRSKSVTQRRRARYAAITAAKRSSMLKNSGRPYIFGNATGYQFVRLSNSGFKVWDRLNYSDNRTKQAAAWGVNEKLTLLNNIGELRRKLSPLFNKAVIYKYRVIFSINSVKFSTPDAFSPMSYMQIEVGYSTRPIGNTGQSVTTEIQSFCERCYVRTLQLSDAQSFKGITFDIVPTVGQKVPVLINNLTPSAPPSADGMDYFSPELWYNISFGGLSADNPDIQVNIEAWIQAYTGFYEMKVARVDPFTAATLQQVEQEAEPAQLE